MIARHEPRHRGEQRQLVGPTGVDAAEQRLDQPVAHLAPHPLGHQSPDPDVLVQVGTLQPTLETGPQGPAAAEYADRAAAPGSVGIPIHVGGSGRTAPRVHTPARVVSGMHEVGAQPDRLGQRDPLGATGQDRLGTEVDLRRPATSPDRSLPPTDVGAFDTVTARLGSATSKARAAARPAMPPPTTATDRPAPLRLSMRTSLANHRDHFVSTPAGTGLDRRQRPTHMSTRSTPEAEPTVSPCHCRHHARPGELLLRLGDGDDDSGG